LRQYPIECLLRTMLWERSESMRISTWLLVFLLGAGIVFSGLVDDQCGYLLVHDQATFSAMDRCS
jgi:hypothetical protein